MIFYEALMKVFEDEKHLDKLTFDNLLEKLKSATEIIREALEDTHHIVEEKHIFPLFKGTKYEPLIKVLEEQHKIGRQITDILLDFCSYENFDIKICRHIRRYLSDYIYMYRAHQSREETIIFSLIRKITTSEQFLRLTLEFKSEMEKKYGKNWYRNTLEKIIILEQSLGIASIGQYTPILDPAAQKFLNNRHFANA